LSSKIRFLRRVGSAGCCCAYFGERDRRFRERDRFGKVGRCAVSIVKRTGFSGDLYS